MATQFGRIDSYLVGLRRNGADATNPCLSDIQHAILGLFVIRPATIRPPEPLPRVE